MGDMAPGRGRRCGGVGVAWVMRGKDDAWVMQQSKNVTNIHARGNTTVTCRILLRNGVKSLNDEFFPAVKGMRWKGDLGRDVKALW